MKQRRLNLKSPRNEMPSPGDPRLKVYERQQAIDKAAMKLVAEGASLQDAYQHASQSAE